MTRVIITTIIRESAPNSVSGRLFVVDITNHQIIQVTDGVEAPHRTQDENPRGGMRGLRGLSIHHGELALALFSSVLIFDRSWQFLRAATHPSVAAIHEILYAADGLWVTSTANNLLARFDHQCQLQEQHFLQLRKNNLGQMVVEKEPAPARYKFIKKQPDFRKRSYFTADSYDRAHLNSLRVQPNGQLVISLGLIVGTLFNFQMSIKTLMIKMKLWNPFLGINTFIRHLFGLKKTMLSELVVQPATGQCAIVSQIPDGTWEVKANIPIDRNPSHSVRCLEDGSFVYLLTSFGEIAHYDPHGKILYKAKVTDKFLRGLLILPDGNFLVGASNCLLFFDSKEKKVFAEIKLSDNELETIFEIQILPDDFDLPPRSLEELTGRIQGYQGNEVLWDRAGYADSRSHS